MKKPEKALTRTKNGPRIPVQRMVMIAVFSAISIVLVALLHVPLFPAAPFLEYDMADVPIIIVTFLYGPLAGLFTTVIVSVLQGLTVSAGSGFNGILMHIFATGCYVLVAGNLYKRHRSLGGEIASLGCGTAAMVAVMTLWNMLLTPLFMKAPFEQAMQLMLPAIIPFNLIKAGGNSLIAYFVFKAIEQVMKRRRA